MLYFQIKDYNEFRDIFGTCKSARGSIQNRILLSFWETRFKRDCELDAEHIGIASKIKNMSELFDTVIENLNQHIPENYQDLGQVHFRIKDQSFVFYCTKYTSIDPGSSRINNNACIDPKCITVWDTRTKKKYNIKISKVFLDACQTNKAIIGEPTTIYCAEELQRRWEAYMHSTLDSLELVVDKDFHKIYNSEAHAGPITSCMNNKQNYHFYEKAVDASAASLIDNNQGGKIVARCIIFHGVEICNREGKYNYAERQYAVGDQGDTYKHILIQKLIEANQIDFYKAIGAGCGDVNALNDVNGRPLKETRVKIAMNLKYNDYLSYQDTFKCYYPDQHYAYNYCANRTGLYHELGHTVERYEWND